MSAAWIDPDHTFTCIRCRDTWKVYALDPSGDARALLHWTCPNCTDLARRRDESDDVLGGPSLAEFADAGAAAAWLVGGALIALVGGGFLALVGGGFLALWGRDLLARLGGA